MVRKFCEVFAALSRPIMDQDALDKVECTLAEALALWQTHAPASLLGGSQFHLLFEVIRHARCWGAPCNFWCFRCGPLPS